MDRKIVKRIFPFALLFSILFWNGAFAHAVLIDADPAPNSHLKNAPSAITLSFSERLEKNYFSSVFMINTKTK
jgi:methionine-rich copper-binding protein CopC